MSFKSQLFVSSSRQRMSISPSWGLSPANEQHMKLVSPWIEYDYSVRPGLAPKGFKWNAVLGIGLATAVSLSIWTGVLIGVARILR
jgi:hypothetical protein